LNLLSSLQEGRENVSHHVETEGNGNEGSKPRLPDITNNDVNDNNLDRSLLHGIEKYVLCTHFPINN
jgi:hypothetical protein